MMATQIIKDGKGWDAFVQAHGGGFLQSWGWAQFQKSLGREAHCVRVEENEIVAQFLLITHAGPFVTRYLYVPRGPVMKDAGSREQFVACVTEIRKAMAEEGAIFGRIEPPYERSASAISERDLEGWGLREAEPMQPKHTVIVDLTKSDEELLAAMHHKARYNIRVAERHGVTVREADYQNPTRDLDLFWKMLGDTAARDAFHTHERAYYEKMLAILSPKNGGDLTVRLLFADHGGEAAAAMLLAEYGGTATYLHGASLAEKRNVMAPYLLHRNAMIGAKRRGMTAYDFWGVAPSDDPDHPWAGITRFKTGFGGRLASYLGAWELPGNRILYTLYRAIKFLRP